MTLPLRSTRSLSAFSNSTVRLKTLIAQEREVLRLAADAGDEVTVALMSDYLKEQEKTVWMLVAFNSPKALHSLLYIEN